MRRSRLGTAAAAATVLMLVGCGEASPGAAATVEGEPIALDEVDAMARAYCGYVLALAEQQPNVPVRTTGYYRNLVLDTLVDAELAEDAVAELGLDVPPAAYEQDLEEFDEPFDALSAAEEAALREYIAVFNELQASLRAIGRDQGGDVPQNRDALIAAGQRYLVAAAEDADIELDPRFGEMSNGRVVGGSGSLSVPSSDEGGGGGAAGGAGGGGSGTDDDGPSTQTCR